MGPSRQQGGGIGALLPNQSSNGVSPSTTPKYLSGIESDDGYFQMLMDDLYEKMKPQDSNVILPAGSSDWRTSFPGMISPGNIDYKTRPIVRNQDGSISTVRGASFDLPDGRAVLLPTISDEGDTMSPKEAYAQYEKTGKHLGIFTDHEAADQYSKMYHDQMGPTDALTRIRGQRQSNVIIPDTGAAKYWYVDPTAQGVPTPSSNNAFDPIGYADEQGHVEL